MILLSQASEEKLKLAQEELAGNRTHQTGLEAQVQALQVDRSSLEQELEKRKQKLQQQEKTVKDSETQQVRVAHKNYILFCIRSVDDAKWGFFLQTQVKEELKREKGKVEELNQVRNNLENNLSRLAGDMKALKEKSDKVCHLLQQSTNVLMRILLHLND